MGAGKGQSKRTRSSRAGDESEHARRAVAASQALLSSRNATLDILSLMGSHAYGFAHADSDHDYRGVYRLSLQDKLGIDRPKDSLEPTEGDVVLHELSKFARLAARGNPGMLEMLFVTPEHASAVGELLRKSRDLFLSQRIIEPHLGFSASLVRKLESNGETMGEAKRAKTIRHCFRVLNQGEQLLRNGTMQVFLDKDEVAKIRGMETKATPEIVAAFEQREADLRSIDSPLPELPNVDAINAMVMRAYLLRQ